jgi:hypothetical protein
MALNNANPAGVTGGAYPDAPCSSWAKNLGHRDTRMVEKHYGHLEPNYIADAIRAGAPKLGFRPDPTVTTLRR